MSESDDAFQSADEGEGETEETSVGEISASDVAVAADSKSKQTAENKRKKKKKVTGSGQPVSCTEDSSDKANSAADSTKEQKVDDQEEDHSEQRPPTCGEEKKTDVKATVATPATEAESRPEKSVDPPRSNSEGSSIEEKAKEENTATRKVDRVKDSPERRKVLENLSEAADKQAGGWGGWGSWGSSLLSTATSSVTTFTSQVGEGFNAVLETVESSLGAPDPEELVKQDVETRKQEREARRLKEPDETPNGQSECSQEDVQEGDINQEIDRGSNEGDMADEFNPEGGATGGKEEPDGDSWFSSWGVPLSGLSNITKQVQDKGKTLVTGGLDVLESVGKKAYDVIAEGDHGLKSTLQNAGSKPNLSQILRDAKEDYEVNSKQQAEFEEARKAHFGSLFDEYNGLVHLEALELVANNSENKVQSILGALPPDDLAKVKVELMALRDKFQIEESDDEEDDKDDQNFAQLAKDYTMELCLPVSADKLTQGSNKARAWLHDCSEEQQQGVKMEAKEIHREAIQMLALMTADSVQHYHKVSQLLQMNPEGPLSTYQERADSLVKLMQLLCSEADILTSRFIDCLNSSAESSDDSNSVNPLITNVYLEAGNSKTYIHDAFQLLLPVFQHVILVVFSKG